MSFRQYINELQEAHKKIRCSRKSYLIDQSRKKYCTATTQILGEFSSVHGERM
jgi:hypothetical protein